MSTNVDDVVLTNISEMIDLAIGTPEVGVVDFCMLQTVLHCLAQQQRVLGKNVELRGGVAALPVGRSVDNSQTITISEYIVDTESPGKYELTTEPLSPDQDSLLVVERKRRTQAAFPMSDGRSISPTPHTTAPETRRTSVTQVPRKKVAVSSSEKLCLVTLSKFNLLENTVEDLKNRVYGTSPKNEEILQEVRSQSNMKAITDMWTNMNVASRLEAAEVGISKLGSLVEDLIGETGDIQKSLGTPSTAMKSTVSTRAPDISPSQAAPSADLAALATKNELRQMLSHLQDMRSEIDDLAKTFTKALLELNPSFVPPPPSKMVLEPAPTESQKLKDLQSQQATMNQLEARLLERLSQLENELKKCCDSVKKSDGQVNDQLTSFQDQLQYMAKQIADLSGGAAGQLTPDLVKDLQGLMKLFETVQNMQAQLQQVHETALNLAAEKTERQNHIDALLEQIELLKVIKLDREDMVEALADKADLRMLARKVSHDQFEHACDDLSKGLEHALGKLGVQESLWQQALDDIQREIEQKLDKMELSPVKEFFNNKLKQLQENLKQMAALRREAEAAGTKKRLLRDVNCISCDAQAVMAMDPVPAQSSKPLPASLSMKPYLTYELDTIRKNQASGLPQRNLHDWENVQQQMQAKPHKVRSDTDKHLCNRYCGGSHTVTTPAQRVARLGHFMKQWGPEVLPLSSGYAAGDDGRLYKISTSEAANVGPGGAVEGAGVSAPKSPVKKPEPPKGPKPMVITAECRCLDPTAERPPPNN